MPISASARKAQRVSLKKREFNKPIRSQLKTDVKKAEDILLKSDVSSAEIAVKQAVKSLDKAARKGIIHSNNAARHKSQLMRNLNRVKAAAPPVEIEEIVEADTE